jgi:hypothetical protein
MHRIAAAFLIAAACGEDLGLHDVAVETGAYVVPTTATA